MTLHSWRHFYATASRQMLMPDELGCEIGHWVSGSRMPETYDAVSSSKELAAKSAIVYEFQEGRTIASPGEVPAPVGAHGKSIVGGWRRTAVTVEDRALQTQANAPDTGNLPITLPEPSPVRKVLPKDRGEALIALNEMYEKVHIYCSSIFPCRPLCNRWDCGSPFEPTNYASFLRKDDPRWLELSPDKWCGNCFTSSRLSNLTCPHSFVPRLDALAAEDSEVSSVASDSSDDT